MFFSYRNCILKVNVINGHVSVFIRVCKHTQTHTRARVSSLQSEEKSKHTYTHNQSHTQRRSVKSGCPCRRGNDPAALSLTCAPVLPWGPECQLTHHRAFSFLPFPFFLVSLLYLWRVAALLAPQRRPRSWQATGFSLSLAFPLFYVPSSSFSSSFLLNWVVWQTGLSTRRHSVGSRCVCV